MVNHVTMSSITQDIFLYVSLNESFADTDKNGNDDDEDITIVLGHSDFKS